MACRRSPVRSRLAPPRFPLPPQGGAQRVPSPSSRGLGHHPFTVDTGVRIPVGTPPHNARASGRFHSRSGEDGSACCGCGRMAVATAGAAYARGRRSGSDCVSMPDRVPVSGLPRRRLDRGAARIPDPVRAPWCLRSDSNRLDANVAPARSPIQNPPPGAVAVRMRGRGCSMEGNRRRVRRRRRAAWMRTTPADQNQKRTPATQWPPSSPRAVPGTASPKRRVQA